MAATKAAKLRKADLALLIRAPSRREPATAAVEDLDRMRLRVESLGIAVRHPTS
jgi:hypothetical protein